MSIRFQVLGQPEADNALWMEIDSGQGITRLLFDCGEGCLATVPFGTLLEVDALLFSHQHMDHIAGFDAFFRCLYSRNNRPNVIWGPPETARILQHRFQGFLWNLHGEMEDVAWWVHEVHPSAILRTRYQLAEAFALAHSEEPLSLTNTRIIDTSTYTIDALTMDHRTTTLAYIVREQPKRNIAMERVSAMGLRPGPWMQRIKAIPQEGDASAEISIGERTFTLGELRSALLTETTGDSVAYLTDFLLDDTAASHLVNALQGVRTVVCESQYRHADLSLARAYFHMTTQLTAELAKAAQIQELVLFHLSRRYAPTEWLAMLDEARAIFPNTRFPEHWDITAV